MDGDEKLGNPGAEADGPWGRACRSMGSTREGTVRTQGVALLHAAGPQGPEWHAPQPRRREGSLESHRRRSSRSFCRSITGSSQPHGARPVSLAHRRLTTHAAASATACARNMPRRSTSYRNASMSCSRRSLADPRRQRLRSRRRSKATEASVWPNSAASTSFRAELLLRGSRSPTRCNRARLRRPVPPSNQPRRRRCVARRVCSSRRNLTRLGEVSR